MTGIFCLFFAVVFVLLNGGVHGDTTDQSRRSKHEFILHRCTATAELRRHTNEQRSNANLGKINENSFQFPKNLTQTREGISEDGSKNFNTDFPPENIHSQLSSERRRTIFETVRNDAGGKRFKENNLENTPLRTVNIKTVHNVPPTFKRKSLLPELERNISSRKINTFPDVIIIKPAT